jgi:hypothetical protein
VITAHVDRAWLPRAEARVSSMGRGFLFGDGACEVIPVYTRRPFRLDEHVARVSNTLAHLRVQGRRAAGAAHEPPDVARHHLRRGARTRTHARHEARGARGARSRGAHGRRAGVAASTKEVLPIASLNGRAVCDGKPGPMGRQMVACCQTFKDTVMRNG